MSKPFTYGVLCEDKAHRNFVLRYLNQCYPNLFAESQPFSWTIKATDKREVEGALPDATRQGFTKFGLDVLFVGRDADTTKGNEVEALKSKLKLFCQSHPKVILMVPVQCIEHWLLYIQWHTNNPASTKNEQLEHITRFEAKKRLYGGKLKVEKQIEKANEILNNIDIDWLESRSESFRHFHTQVRLFVDSYQ